jgi:EmrB/QacA subfamily drug resistance transporter
MRVALPCVAQFVVVLDATIVAIALPAIGADLGLETASLGWLLTGYTLVFGGCLIAAGRLADRVGRRRIFAAGLLLFGAASLACGLAPTGATLLAARAVQGLGAALVSPAALALVTAARPDGPQRARALGWWTAAAAGGGAGGWALGGVLSGLLDWRWIFLVNVPPCLIAAALARRRLPEWRDPRPKRLDAAGAVLATTGLSAVVLALTLVETGGAHAPALIAVAAGALLLAALAAVESRAPDPLLDRAVIRRVGAAAGVAAVITATTSPVMLLCTLHAQRVLGLDPLVAGLLFPPFNLAVIAGSLLGPGVAARLGERRAMAAGLAAIAAGAVALRAIAPHASPVATLLGGFVALGVGVGIASVASTSEGTAALAGEDQGLASGLLATAAQLGAALGLAVIVPLAAAYAHAHGGGARAQVDGYELGFAIAAVLAGAAGAATALTARRAQSTSSSTAGVSNASI